MVMKTYKIESNGHEFDILEIENFRINHKCPFCSSTYFYKYFWGLLRHVENVHIPRGRHSRWTYDKDIDKRRTLTKLLYDYVSDNPSVKWKEKDLSEHRLEEML